MYYINFLISYAHFDKYYFISLNTIFLLKWDQNAFSKNQI